MIGTLTKTDSGWQVSHSTYNEITKRWIAGKLPLHPDDVKQIQEDSQRFDNIEARIVANPIVNFEIVKENVDTGALEAPYIKVEYAKLINTEYPELEGTNALCEDIIAARANESVPAPDELQEELRRVRSAKNSHVKSQKWELAALYREIEKLLEAEEPTCSNCQMLLSAIGVGQGLICDLNKCRIPHSKHSCQYHFKTVTKSAETASFDSEIKTRNTIETRPWGQYEVILDADNCKVKRITVNPGGRLSLQYHHKRSEHWIVIAGTAHVTIGDAIKVVEAGESCYLPLRAQHRVQNLQSDPLVFIEVQTGTYFGEDDIVRIEDDYNRA